MNLPVRQPIPNPYQIAGQAVGDLNGQVQQYGQEEDALQERFRLMLEKRAQAALTQQDFEQEQALKSSAEKRAQDEADQKKELHDQRMKFLSRPVGEGGVSSYSEPELRNALASGVIDSQTYKDLSPEKPKSEVEVGGALYHRLPDGSFKQVIAPKPQDPPTPKVIQTNEGVFSVDERTGKAIPVSGPGGKPLGGKKAFAPADIAKAKASYVNSSSSLDRLADEALAIKNDPQLFRAVGSIGAFPSIPGSAAADVAARIETLKSKAGFAVLQNMRDLSKTGGALGNVSDYEGRLLQSNISALDKSQSPEAFRASLDIIIQFSNYSKNHLHGAYTSTFDEEPGFEGNPSSQNGISGQGDGSGGIAPPSSPAAGATRVGRFNVRVK